MSIFKAIDLFCGAGGLSSGLKKAHFNIAVGVDIDKTAISTYTNNFPNTKALLRDIKEVAIDDILEVSGIKIGDNFLLAGCPPCQGFSSIGKRDENDIKNQLAYEYVRIVDGLQPTFILMENVPGMARGIGKNIFSNIIEMLQKNYQIQYSTLNAADYGVPQKRKRLVLHGIRIDVYDILLDLLEKTSIDFLPPPTHSNKKRSNLQPWKTVRDSILDLPELCAGEECHKPDVFNHVARNLSSTNKKRLKTIRNLDGNRSSLPSELILDCHKKENVSYKDTYGIMKLDSPAPTITSGCTLISKGRFGHPTQNRGISVREAARLQSFEDTFIFSGNIGSMSLQVGNAVPPKLAEESGKIIKYYMEIYEEYLKSPTL